MSALEQVQAYNQGVRDALAQAAAAAAAAAAAIEKLPNYRKRRQGFATAALRGSAEAGTELLIGEPHAAIEVKHDLSPA
jgi:hypothetical protein